MNRRGKLVLNHLKLRQVCVRIERVTFQKTNPDINISIEKRVLKELDNLTERPNFFFVVSRTTIFHGTRAGVERMGKNKERS